MDTSISTGTQHKGATSVTYVSDNVGAVRYETVGHPSTLTLFNENPPKNMQLDSTGTKCVAWCPPSGTYFNPIQVGTGKNGTSKGVQDGDTWSWTDNLFIIPMDHKHLTLKSGAVPTTLLEEITPFGGKCIANATQTFHNDFKPSVADASKFTVTNLASCPKASNCQNGYESLRITDDVERLLLSLGDKN